MDQYNDSEISDVTIDYARNKKFFDKKYMKNNSILRGIGWVLAGVGGVCAALAMIGVWALYMVGWPLLITGVVILCVALAKQVKDSEVIEVFEGKNKQFTEVCREKLDFPDDFTVMSMTFMGCRLEKGTEDLRKLKNGNYINQNPEITFLYIDSRKKVLFIGYCCYSLTEESEKVEYLEIPYADFDRAELVRESVDDGKGKLCRFVLSGAGKEIFSSPLSDSDYYKEEFIGDIVHKKELKR